MERLPPGISVKPGTFDTHELAIMRHLGGPAVIIGQSSRAHATSGTGELGARPELLGYAVRSQVGVAEN